MELLDQVAQRAVYGAIESVVIRERVGKRLQMPCASSSDENTEKRSSESEQPRRKKRKSTYHTRKEEMARLEREIAMLQSRVRFLEQQPDGRLASHQSIVESAGRYTVLHEQVRQQSLSIVHAESLISSYKPMTLHQSPLGCFIRLTRDQGERQRTLRALKMAKMREAADYMRARSRFVDLTRSSRQMDIFEVANGDFISIHWEVNPLEEAPSVRRAFEEVLYFRETQELSISEKLGVLSIRESDIGDENDDATQLRIVTTYENGVQAESNLAVFSHYFEAGELMEAPSALLVGDNVDEDELFPYQPSSRIRKDVSSFELVTECPREDGPPLVVLVRWAFLRTHFNPHASKDDLNFVAREGVGRYCDAMLSSIRERLALLPS